MVAQAGRLAFADGLWLKARSAWRKAILGCPNHLQRQFKVAQPDQFWVTDITYIRTHEGWLYLTAVVDLFSRQVVGSSMSSRIDTALVSAVASNCLNANASDVGSMRPAVRRKRIFLTISKCSTTRSAVVRRQQDYHRSRLNSDMPSRSSVSS